MCVDLLLFGLIQRHKAIEDIITSSSVVSATLVVGEIVLHRADGQLLLESIDLVQEENDGRLDEPTGIANRVKQGQGFLHTVDGLILKEKLIVFGNGNQEKNRGDVLETMNPLLTLGTLTTDVKHTVGEVANDEGGFSNTSGLYTRA